MKSEFCQNEIEKQVDRLLSDYFIFYIFFLENYIYIWLDETINLFVGDQNLLVELFSRKLSMTKDSQTKKYPVFCSLVFWKGFRKPEILLLLFLLFYS